MLAIITIVTLELLLLQIIGKQKEAHSYFLTFQGTELTAAGPSEQSITHKGKQRVPSYSATEARLPSALYTWDQRINSSGHGGRELS